MGTERQSVLITKPKNLFRVANKSVARLATNRPATTGVLRKTTAANRWRKSMVGTVLDASAMWTTSHATINWKTGPDEVMTVENKQTKRPSDKIKTGATVQR